MPDERLGVTIITKDEFRRALCRGLKVPPWVIGIRPRPWWPTRLVYWLRGYRP